MASPTLTQRLDALTALVERLAPAVAAPVAPTAHVGPSGKPDGRRFPCTASPACGRLLRSAKRAAIHGVDAGGHNAG
jgi:hypothetical protein